MPAVALYRNKTCKTTEDMVSVRMSDDVVAVTKMSNEIENGQPMIKGLQFQKCSAMLTER